MPRPKSEVASAAAARKKKVYWKPEEKTRVLLSAYRLYQRGGHLLSRTTLLREAQRRALPESRWMSPSGVINQSHAWFNEAFSALLKSPPSAEELATLEPVPAPASAPPPDLSDDEPDEPDEPVVTTRPSLPTQPALPVAIDETIDETIDLSSSVLDCGLEGPAWRDPEPAQVETRRPTPVPLGVPRAILDAAPEQLVLGLLYKLVEGMNELRERGVSLEAMIRRLAHEAMTVPVEQAVAQAASASPRPNGATVSVALPNLAVVAAFGAEAIKRIRDKASTRANLFFIDPRRADQKDWRKFDAVIAVANLSPGVLTAIRQNSRLLHASKEAEVIQRIYDQTSRQGQPSRNGVGAR